MLNVNKNKGMMDRKREHIKKLYIPIISTIDGGDRRGITMISADRIPDLKSILPQEEVVLEHLNNLKKSGKQYSTFKIQLPGELFDNILKSISLKSPTNSKKKLNAIDLVLDLETKPIIQILRRTNV